jgi:ABC-2 family transporter protein
MSLAAVTAQAQADLLTRLRSSGTFFAFPLICAGAYLWIPKPGGRAASITWRSAEGVVQTPAFDAAYAGTATTILGAIFVLLVAFYLVCGSLRRDRQSGVGALLAASPITKAECLTGKFLAYAAYLAVVSLLILAVGLVRFLAYGEGSFNLGPFVLPFALVVGPAIAFVAAATLLFEVTPGLRGRGGLVAWFFVATFGLMVLPGALSRDRATGRDFRRLPFFDPAGAASLQVAIQRSFGDTVPLDMSSGLIIHDQPPVEIQWAGPHLDAGFVAARLAAFAWALLPLAASVALFDRFDPSRKAGRSRRPSREPRPSAPAEDSMASVTALAPFSIQPRPSVWAAVEAEARLVWQAASWLKWPLAASALAAPLFAGEAARLGAGAFLLLLAPVVSEAAAREDLEGTRGLVFSQPSIPAWPILSKLLGVFLFVLALGAPFAVRVTLRAPAEGLTLVTGFAFVAAFAVGAGSLTRGGKLFTSVYLLLWYGALSGAPALDFSGALSGHPRLATALAYVTAGGVLVFAAALAEQRRQKA